MSDLKYKRHPIVMCHSEITKYYLAHRIRKEKGHNTFKSKEADRHIYWMDVKKILYART